MPLGRAQLATEHFRTRRYCETRNVNRWCLHKFKPAPEQSLSEGRSRPGFPVEHGDSAFFFTRSAREFALSVAGAQTMDAKTSRGKGLRLKLLE